MYVKHNTTIMGITSLKIRFPSVAKRKKMNSAELGRSQDGKSISQSHLFALEIPLKKLEALTLQK